MFKTIQYDDFEDLIHVCQCGYEGIVEFEKPYLLKGVITNKNFKQDIEIHICESCACNMGQWQEV